MMPAGIEDGGFNLERLIVLRNDGGIQIDRLLTLQFRCTLFEIDRNIIGQVRKVDVGTDAFVLVEDVPFWNNGNILDSQIGSCTRNEGLIEGHLKSTNPAGIECNVLVLERLIHTGNQGCIQISRLRWLLVGFVMVNKEDGNILSVVRIDDRCSNTVITVVGIPARGDSNILCFICRMLTGNQCLIDLCLECATPAGIETNSLLRKVRCQNGGIQICQLMIVTGLIV